MSDVDQLYQAVIVDHDRTPRNAGRLPEATHHATIDNPLCGDVVTVDLRIEDGVVRAISFEGRGCALSRAAASIMTTQVVGRDAAALRALAAAFSDFVRDVPDGPTPAALGELSAFAGVRRFRSRQACALLGFRALMAALEP
jgi:nitrogen fixation NifU-like protein